MMNDMYGTNYEVIPGLVKSDEMYNQHFTASFITLHLKPDPVLIKLRPLHLKLLHILEDHCT